MRKHCFKILLIVLLLSCVRKKSFVWKGWHADVTTTENPKEDIKVDDYIVVSYSPCESNTNATVLYEFALTKAGEQFGLVHLEKFEGFGYLLCYEYFVKDMAFIKREKCFYSLEHSSYATLEIYRDRPSYEELKYKVITALTRTSALTNTQITATGDSIKIVLSADGTWEPWVFSDSGKGDLKLLCPYESDSGAALAIPRFVTTTGNQRVRLTDDGSWDFLPPEELLPKNTTETILLVKNPPPREIVPYSKAEIKPKPVNIPTPVYPELARRAGIEGDVVTKALLDIDIDGSVMKAGVLKSSNNGMLDLEALRTSMKAKFTPAIQKGHAVRVWVSIPIRFRLY